MSIRWDTPYHIGSFFLLPRYLLKRESVRSCSVPSWYARTDDYFYFIAVFVLNVLVFPYSGMEKKDVASSIEAWIPRPLFLCSSKCFFTYMFVILSLILDLPFLPWQINEASERKYISGLKHLPPYPLVISFKTS